MTTEGKAGRQSIPRRSIAAGDQIPNVAVFVKRTALEFLQILFGSREPGSYHYDADDSLTEIQIADQHNADLDSINVRPAIIGIRGPLSWQGQGLGGGAVEHRRMPTGKHTFSDLLTGSMAFSCISREGTEAEQLGHLVFNSFKFFRPVLQRYGFFSIKSLNIGAESLVEQEGADDKTYIVPVFLTVSVQDRWSLDNTAARTLEGIIIEHLTSP